MRSRTKYLACLLGVALAVPALAQSGSVTQYPACPDPPPKLSQTELDAAHASYRVGVEAYETGDYNKALDNFRDSFRRDCSKVALLNFIARAYEGKGDKAEAIHALETYLQRNPKADDAEKIQIRIQNLKSQLGQSTATTTSPTTTVTVTATSTATAVPTATTTATVTESGGHTAGPWIVVGVGVAAGIAGGVLIGVGQSKLADASAGCSAPDPSGTRICPNLPGINDPDASRKERTNLQSQGNTLRGVGIAVGAVGIAAIVGGLVWHFVEPSKKTTAAFTPVITPGYAGLSFGGSF